MSDELERWAPRIADRFARIGREAVTYLHPERERLAGTVRRLAPTRTLALRRSILDRGLQVLTTSTYAEFQSTGGVIKAQRHGWLTIPVRPGYTPSAGYTTVRGRDGHQYVVRSGTLELWAVRRRSVRIPGTRYLDRALSTHMSGADERIAARLVDEVTR